MSIWLSSDKSATSFFSRLFSSSRVFNRLASSESDEDYRSQPSSSLIARRLTLLPAVLVSPAMIRRLADLQRLQNLAQALPGVEQPVRILELLHDLIRPMPLPRLL